MKNVSRWRCDAGDAMGILRLAPLEVKIKSYPIAEMGERQVRHDEGVVQQYGGLQENV